MKTIEISQLDDTDLEFADILTQYGLTKHEGKVLVCVNTQENIMTKQIEMRADMRQPEVSAAVRGLIEKGYVKVENEVRGEDSGKGRPQLVYSLSKPMNEIISDIERNANQQIDDINESMQRLKELA